jgi:hypothetical protein
VLFLAREALMGGRSRRVVFYVLATGHPVSCEIQRNPLWLKNSTMSMRGRDARFGS